MGCSSIQIFLGRCRVALGACTQQRRGIGEREKAVLLFYYTLSPGLTLSEVSRTASLLLRCSSAILHRLNSPCLTPLAFPFHFSARAFSHFLITSALSSYCTPSPKHSRTFSSLLRNSSTTLYRLISPRLKPLVLPLYFSVTLLLHSIAWTPLA